MNATEAQAAALKLARGTYQKAIVTGEARLSGADLKGEAGRWGARYAGSRAALFGRIAASGIPYRECKGDHGFRYIVWGDE